MRCGVRGESSARGYSASLGCVIVSCVSPVAQAPSELQVWLKRRMPPLLPTGRPFTLQGGRHPAPAPRGVLNQRPQHDSGATPDHRVPMHCFERGATLVPRAGAMCAILRGRGITEAHPHRDRGPLCGEAAANTKSSHSIGATVQHFAATRMQGPTWPTQGPTQLLRNRASEPYNILLPPPC